MTKRIYLPLAILALVGLSPLLGGCHTTAGLGEDVSAGANAVSRSAEKHAP